MPMHSLKPPSKDDPQVSSPPAKAEQTEQDQLGNAAVVAQLSSEMSSGRLSWESALGETIGGKLYEEISDKISEDELQAVAGKAVDSAMDALKKRLEGATDVSEEEAAAMFVAELDKQLTRVAQGAVSGGIADALQGFVDDNPLLIASALVAGAVAYVLSNQEIGMVDTKLGLGGGHSLIGGVDMGSTMDIALETVRLGYRYSGGGAKVEVVGDYFTGDESYSLLGRYEQSLTDDRSLSLSGSHSEQTDRSLSRLDLKYGSASFGASAFAKRERGLAGGDVDTFGGGLHAKGADWSAYARGQHSSDGAWQAAAGYHKDLGDQKSFGIEAFGGKDRFGQRASGVQAVVKWRF